MRIFKDILFAIISPNSGHILVMWWWQEFFIIIENTNMNSEVVLLFNFWKSVSL